MRPYTDGALSDSSLLTVIALAAAGLALAWLVVLQVRTSALLRNYRRLLNGASAGNLEEIMAMHVGRINEHERRLGGLDGAVADLGRVLQTAIQRVGLVRFNPFQETGGDQSFAIALLDQHDNGLVVSSLHSRTETRVYAKPIEDGRSRYTLSEEEEQALQQAGVRLERAAR
ncbi:MAG: DUF4446 family protein [Chloroflexi bacterium]|nr:DUF4446 family protein [Chloroflexota bacterium]